MKVYAISRGRYVISFNDNETKELQHLRKLYSFTNIQILKLVIRWGLNFFFNTKQD